MPEQNNPGTSIMQKNSRSSAVLRSKSHHHKESKMHHTEYKTHLRDGSKLRELPQQVPHSVPKSPSELHSNKFSPFGNDVTVNKYRQDTKYHHCTLPGEPTDVLTRYIEAGVWVSLRRSIRRALMISSKHPYTKYFAPSLYRRKEEETRQLLLYYHIIHPLSMFTFYFEMFMFFVFAFKGIANPIILMVFHDDKQSLRAIFYPSNVLHILLILTSLCTGYYDNSQNVVYMKRRLIVLNYLQSYFITDILAILPQLLRTETVNRLGFNYDLKTYSTRFITPIFIAANYARYIWCLRILRQLRLYFGLSIYAYQTIRLIMNALTAVVFSVYILFTIMKFMPGYIKDSVLKHSEHVVKMLMMVSYGPPVFKQMHETVCPMIFIIIGFVFHLIMLIHGAEIWLKFFSKDYKQSAVYGATEAYMRYRALPMSLRERIYLYLDFRYQGHFYKESVIRNATSVALRREILLTMTQKSIEKVELFENCPVIILNKIKASLVSNIYLPGDVIIKSGTTGHCMFFILAGTVVVTTTDNKELCYLRDGSHFGEIALVVNIKRVANVIAVTACELFKLDRNHFWEVMKNHPQAYNNIKTMATERVANTSQSIADISIRDSIFSTATNRSGDKPEIAIAY
ncbi:potassium/sodium hyperpolarization-activated cyclic nucleotide-gated channel 1-like [Dendroctonus ponderosae]|uniref:potassium/sodium hyperpolarization-activated cyclic nucleotide-gated channel 1-like n=1 Tax=Dendroctonus ponderosae TaxID=77166 RepID=UPI002035B8C9|nr:potassium/sodium hyperpolarization-activated cyclic nucleotide-gated channel 1-like [Dendroctonus ponderosae]KAH1025628.1 hypothetical protein HUJ05_010319 [Dendroctonus ponderosae]